MKILILSLLVLSLVLPLNVFAVEEKEIPTLENKIAQLVNDYRKSQGLNELSYEPGISGVAKAHSQDMATRHYIAHETFGTNRNSIQRGVDAGYALCGDMGALNRYHKVVADITEYKRLTAKFQRDAETVRLYWSNDPLQNQIINSQYDKLVKMQQEVNSRIMITNHDIRDGKIRISLSENIMGLELDSRSIEELSNATISGWVESQGHKRVLEDTMSHAFGVGATIDRDQNKVLVTLNIC